MATLDAALEAMIVQGLHDPATGQPVIEPDLARTIGERVAELVASRGANAPPIALIVQPRARRALAALAAHARANAASSSRFPNCPPPSRSK